MKLLCQLCSLLLLGNLFVLTNSECTKGVYESVVNEDEQNFIVNYHNDFRLLIARGEVPDQPRGVNLKRLSWDADIAQAAQNIANTCVFEHVGVEDPRWSVGQNLATTYNSAYVSGANWTEAILMWWNEHSVYTFGSEFSKDTGHYTQLVWDDTQFVGCGYTFYPIDGEYQYQKLYVCNYGPAGNYPRPPYTTGDSGCENLC